MRLLSVAVALTLLSPVCAEAQTAALASAASPSDRDLSDALFVSRGPAPVATPSDSTLRARGADGAAAFGQVFATPALPGESLSGQPQVSAAGQGLIAFSSSEMSRPTGGGAVDSVRLTTLNISRTPLAGPNTAYEPGAVDLAFTRGWPNAVSLQAAGLGLNVSPHAGIGFDSVGGNNASAGAMIRLSSAQTAIQDKLNAMGVKNGASYGDQGRWYLFAAVKGQSVGLNMMGSGLGGLHQAGWSTDASSALVGDGQAGLGYRKGWMEASLGYVHRGVKLINAPYGASDSFQENLAAFSLTFHPGFK
jgi:hypothetical protein